MPDKRLRSPIVTVVALVLALLVAACSGAPPSDEVRVALQFPPRAGYAFDAGDGGLLTKLGVAEPLVPDGAPAPGLATSWTQQPDGRTGRYDMFLNSRSYLSDFPDPAGVLASDYGCGGSYAIDRYCSPAFDALVARLGTTSDPAARAALFREAAGVLVTDAVGVPLVHPRNTAAERGVTGYWPDPLDLRPVLPALAPAPA